MQRHSTALVGLMLAAACDGPLRWYEATREECGLAEREDVPLPWDVHGTSSLITADCADRLGQRVGIRWSDWDTYPQDVEGGESLAVPDMVVAGLFVMLSTDYGSIGESLDDPSMPEAVGSSLRQLGLQASFSEDDPMGALWLEYSRQSIGFMVASADTPSGGSPISYSDGTVQVSSLVGVEPWNHPAIVASAIFHEAAHAELPGHIECDNSSTSGRWCDSDVEGANGAGIWWSHRWLESAYFDVPSEECLAVAMDIQRVCSYVGEGGDYAPCQTALSTCVSGAAIRSAWTYSQLAVSLGNDLGVVVSGIIEHSSIYDEEESRAVLYYYSDSFDDLIAMSSAYLGSELDDPGDWTAFSLGGGPQVGSGDGKYSVICVRLVGSNSNLAEGTDVGCIAEESP